MRIEGSPYCPGYIDYEGAKDHVTTITQIEEYHSYRTTLSMPLNQNYAPQTDFAIIVRTMAKDSEFITLCASWEAALTRLHG